VEEVPGWQAAEGVRMEGQAAEVVEEAEEERPNREEEVVVVEKTCRRSDRSCVMV